MKIENFNTSCYQSHQAFGRVLPFSTEVKNFIRKRSKIDTALPGVIKTVIKEQRNNKACDIVTFIRDNNLIIRLVEKATGNSITEGYTVNPKDAAGTLSHYLIEANIFANRANYHAIGKDKIASANAKQVNSLEKALKKPTSIFDKFVAKITSPIEIKT